MKVEARIFAACAAFCVLVAPSYWFITGDPTGTAALTMTALLALLVAFYLGFHSARMDARPEDRGDAEISDGAGELGFFSPYSWWPLWCGLCLATIVFGFAMHQWWLCIIGVVFGALSLVRFIFEYYVGDHAH
ncbi:MAG: hypothetical protein QOK15_268 [Nocardioidaceae bacterium]|jgi:hypothetical protein|nr:hypothetical protein [Nocardioidaceae bacterium]